MKRLDLDVDDVDLDLDLYLITLQRDSIFSSFWYMKLF